MASDEWPIGIAFVEIDDHFLANAWDVDETPLLAGGRGGDAQPARRLVVALSVAIPEELNFYPAILVGVDLVPRRASDDGGLRARAWLSRRHGWAEGHVRRYRD